MKLIFDQDVPKKLRTLLSGHFVRTAWEEGWSTLQNGELLRRAEQHGFQVMITADQNIAYQQNNAERRIALVVLNTTKWSVIQTLAFQIAEVAARSSEGSYECIHTPKCKDSPEG